ncbi:FHA domain-containing protein [Cellulomonas shaoxiangyii]|uniref:FHA domain-containing protein n=1 Tax=Cellulomonas shaoxiangyii TaxID=2566013 RepID=A0A4P7SJK3_9CELL|nr:FHA domain-containing protein [Cellulomonas shaoxiangyii]QCB93286.1 FHA domain-containing protein [Cellulomonas shaoxiangyii]TGY82494.1 FHA domain-containing protein [Cellulomonas shaoxiangyii]
MSASYTVGRSPQADIHVDDEYASPLHARLYQDDAGQVWVEDLASTNGTFVNDVRAPLGTPVRVGPGDTVRVGRTALPWRP